MLSVPDGTAHREDAGELTQEHHLSDGEHDYIDKLSLPDINSIVISHDNVVDDDMIKRMIPDNIPVSNLHVKHRVSTALPRSGPYKHSSRTSGNDYLTLSTE